MSEEMNSPKFDPVMLPTKDLYEFEGNPNEQDPITFNNLVSEIDEDGWDEPMVVVPREVIDPTLKGGHFVVSGNHRLKAAHVLDLDEAPCIVKNTWDSDKAHMKVVRRNMLRGEVSNKKLAKFVQSFSDGYTTEQLADMMGFRDVDAYEKIVAEDAEGDTRAGQEGAADAKDEMNLIDGLSLILNRIFTEYGETVPHSFLFFLYGSKIHLVVQTNTKLKKLLETVTQRCVSDQLDINLVLSGLLAIGMQATNFEQGPPEHGHIETAALEGEDEDYELTPVVGPGVEPDED